MPATMGTLLSSVWVLWVNCTLSTQRSRLAPPVSTVKASLQVALGSLVFMVVIHKLEYFLNARIIGAQINAKSWEMLTAILVMEALFGLPGVVAAPVYYAYVKKELGDQKWV